MAPAVYTARIGRWLAIALLAALAPCAAQPVFDRLTRADGLPSDYILAMHQDQFGFLWIGTDAGLARYDGNEVRTFTVDDGLPDPFVYSITESGDGTLWVGTFRGLARRVRDRFVREEALGSARIASVTTDGEGNLWALRDDGASARRRGRWVHLGVPSGGTWQALAPLADASVLVTVGTGDLVTSARLALDGDAIRVFPGPEPSLQPFGLGSPGRIGWSVDARMLLRGDVEGEQFRERDRIEEIGSTPALETAAGGMVTTGSSGASEWSPVTRQWSRLMTAAVESAVLDREGSVWLGTFGQGAWRLRARHLTRLTDHATTRVRVIEGQVWATGDRLVRVDRQSRAVSLVSAEFGFRAIGGGADGLFVSQRESVKSLSDNGVGETAFKDTDWVSDLVLVGETWWVGTYGRGIVRRRGGEVIDTIGVAQGMPTGMVESLHPTSEGVWALTRSAGASRIEPDHVRVLGVEQGMPGAAVFSVAEAGGAVWFGTGQGLGRWTGGRVEGLGQDILGGQRVHAVFERLRQSGTVWAVGERALYRVDGDTVRAVDGFPVLPDPTASINGAAYDSETDMLYLATTGGLVAVDLAAIPFGSVAPLVAVRRVTVDGRSVPLIGTPREARVATLSPGRHRVEVGLSAIAFASEAQLEYRYDGGSWQSVGDRRQVAFDDLGQGRHGIEIRARTDGGRVSEDSARLDIEVLPFWWQRPAVVALGLVLLLAAFSLGVRALSLRRIRLRLTAAEREAGAERRVRQERERISRDLHDHVGAQLASLLAGVELARLAPGTDPSTDWLQPIEADARATIGQLRETIWALHDESLTVGAFCDRLRAFASQRSRAHPATVEVVCGIDASVTLPPAVALGLYRIAQEGTSNALKHSGSAHVEIRLTMNGDHVTLLISDQGVFRTPTGGDGLSGFGLRSMESRVSSLGGTFALDTSDGTRVQVDVPIGFSRE